MLFNQIKLLKNNDNENKKKINELNNKIEQKEKEIKDLINKKDIIINDMNNKIINLETTIINQENNYKELLNKHGNEIKLLEDKIKTINDKIAGVENNNNEIKNNIEEKANELNNKIIEEQNIVNKIIDDIMSNIQNIINNKINNEIKNLENKINFKFKEQEKNINLYEYEKKTNYKFKKDPNNLKFKSDITTTNSDCGWNDRFEIFILYIDNKEYLVSPNSNNFNLDIFDLSDNKLVYSLPGHNNLIRTIKYNDDYLISADDDKIVIIWDINNNYKIKHLIKTNYEHDINSCLLFFDDKSGKNNRNYIITSTFNYSGNDKDSATKIYSFEDGKFIRNINKTNNIPIFYLLSWTNESTWGKNII